jgi:pimeloyl-ACP methyl ester carboxylesterase
VNNGECVVNGVRLVYDLHGAGSETVVLAGPLGAPGRAWVPYQVPVLVDAGYRVVTFSPRGVPPSEVPTPPYSVADMVSDVAGLIEELADGSVAMVGYSMGALVTQELALARPDLLRGAVLLGTLGRKDCMRRALFDASLDALESGQWRPPKLEAVTRALELFAPSRLDDDGWAQAYLGTANVGVEGDRDTMTGLLGQQEATTAYDDRLDALEAISVPVLVMGFELDLLVSAKLTREVAHAIPTARYVEIPGCGHGGPWERPERINPLVLEFLAELRPAPRSGPAARSQTTMTAPPNTEQAREQRRGRLLCLQVWVGAAASNRRPPPCRSCRRRSRPRTRIRTAAVRSFSRALN